MDAEFTQLYSSLGRPSIPPERLLRASLLQLLYSIRSERQLMERLEFDLLFRWFVGLGIDDPVWDATSFTKNRERVLNEAIAQAFLSALLGDPKVKRLLSHEHFTVDGTLLKAWASMKSFRRKDGGDKPPDGGRNGERDFRAEKRSNETHASTTDSDARLYRKGTGQESRLCYMGHVLMENRHGLIVNAVLTRAYGQSETDAALWMAQQIEGAERVTLAADKGYDQRSLVEELRRMQVTPHVAQNDKRAGGSAIDGRTTRHEGYRISQRVRKRVEEIFGWMKTVGLLDKLRHRGVELANWVFLFTATAYNLVRMRNLLLPAAA